jgi:5'-3' exonuclease
LKKDGLETLLREHEAVVQMRGTGILAKDTKTGEYSLDMEALMDLLDRLVTREVAGIAAIDREYQEDVLSAHDIALRSARKMHGTAMGDKHFWPKRSENKSGMDIRPGSSGWMPRYYHTLFGSTRLSYIDDACRNYYYFNHRYAPEYYYRYYYSPLICDIVKMMVVKCYRSPEPGTVMLSDRSVSAWADTMAQLIMVLPPRSHHLLPEKIRGVLMNDGMGLSFSFPTKFQVITYLKQFGWECIPDLPPISPRAVRAFVAAQSNVTVP